MLSASRGGSACRAARSLPLPLCLRPSQCGPILTGALSATAGSVVSQAVGVATGIQDRFDWKGVALSALSGAVGGAFGNVNPFSKGSAFLTGVGNGAVRGVLGSLVTQGLAMATGLQKEMNWLGVATAAAGGGVAGGLGNALKLETLAKGLSPANIARTALTNTAAGIANAATRALATGTSFGDNVLAVLPDVLGQTVGGLIAGGINGSGRDATAPMSSAAPAASDTGAGPGYLADGASGDNASSFDGTSTQDGIAASALPGSDGWHAGDILVTSDKYKASLFRTMNKYQLKRYTDEYGEFSFAEGAKWALGLSEPQPDNSAYWRSHLSGQSVTSGPGAYEAFRNGIINATASGYALIDSAYQAHRAGNYATASVKYIGSLGLRSLQTADYLGQLLVSAPRGHGLYPTIGDKQDAAVISVVIGGKFGQGFSRVGRTASFAAESAVVGSGLKLLPGEGLVGTYSDLIAAGTKGDNITPHHIPSRARMELEGVSKGDGISINMEQPVPGVGGRHRATFTYRTQADIAMTPRDALVAGVRDARQIYRGDGLYTPQIRSSLQDLIRMNKNNHPTIFVK